MRRAPTWIVGFALLGCGPTTGTPLTSTEFAVRSVCGGPAVTPGVDVSKWQGAVQWAAVKQAGMAFAIVRVSDGLNTPDAWFASNWRGVGEAGMIRGVYQFFRASQDPVAQAELLLQMVAAAGGFAAGDLPPAIDVETSSGQSPQVVQQAVGSWIAHIEQHTGRRPIIYTGSYFWDEHQLGTRFASYPLWTAHYTDKPCPLVADPWPAWTLWQHSSTGRVAGIEGDVDLNRFDGDLAQLTAFAAGRASDEAPADSGPLSRDAGADAGLGLDASVVDAAPFDGGVGGDGTGGCRVGSLDRLPRASALLLLSLFCRRRARSAGSRRRRCQ